MRSRPSIARSPVLRIGLAFFSAALSALLAACSPRSCEEAEAEYYRRLDECEVDYYTDKSDANVCTDMDRQFAECAISCTKDVSCEAVREEGEEGAKVSGCLYYCLVFLYWGLPAE